MNLRPTTTLQSWKLCTKNHITSSFYQENFLKEFTFYLQYDCCSFPFPYTFPGVEQTSLLPYYDYSLDIHIPLLASQDHVQRCPIQSGRWFLNRTKRCCRQFTWQTYLKLHYHEYILRTARDLVNSRTFEIWPTSKLKTSGLKSAHARTEGWSLTTQKRYLFSHVVHLWYITYYLFAGTLVKHAGTVKV